jgi:hypothetical protein
MKTQTIKFIKEGKVVAKATGSFGIVPRVGPVSWEGEWVNNPPHVFNDGLPDHSYAGDFVEAMTRIATTLGLRVEVEESGDWEVYYE